LGRPDDIGYAAVYLASDESEWVTGEALAVNGGVHIERSDHSCWCGTAN